MADTTISQLTTTNALLATSYVPVSDGTTTTKLATGSLLGFRNRIINGDMRIDQRNAGASVTAVTNGTYNLDRWVTFFSRTSKFSIQQNAGAVVPPAGFSNYVGITSSSAYSLTVNDEFSLMQFVEGFNSSDFGFGTANAKSITLSFWVRSSLTGTFGGSVVNSSNNEWCYPYTYAINSANTWEYKTVTIPGQTAGTWLTTNGIGMGIIFSLGAGSSRSGTANTWVNANRVGVPGQVNLVSTNGATLYITGVQLEAGPTATPFERIPIGMELALCQRYCFVAPQNWAYAYGGSGSALVNFYTAAYFPVPMRITPVVSALTFSVVNCSSPTEAALISYRASYYTYNSVHGFATFGNNAGAIYNAEL